MATCGFLTEEQVLHVQETFGTPVFVYDQRTLESQARQALALPNAYGLTVRYAMKALPNRAVIGLFAGLGLHIDASSGFEARRAMLAGVGPDRIQITAQEMPRDLEQLLDCGVRFNACSLHQLRSYGGLRPARRSLCASIQALVPATATAQM
jgi:diaminopimelate decarboxylase